MKKILVFSIIVCLIIVTGCSMMAQKESRSIVGTWTATHDTGARIVIEFKPDLTMEFNVPEYNEYSFKAKYIVDYSKNPVTLDFIDVDSGGIQGNAFMGIVKFTEDNELEFFGEFGSSGQVKRPGAIKKYAELPEIYLLLKKKTD